MPLISPEPRYFSMPSSDDGGADFRKAALNCCPCSRWTSHLPDAWTNSPAEIEAAWPSTVTRSRCPRTLTRSSRCRGCGRSPARPARPGVRDPERLPSCSCWETDGPGPPKRRRLLFDQVITISHHVPSYRKDVQRNNFPHHADRAIGCLSDLPAPLAPLLPMSGLP